MAPALPVIPSREPRRPQRTGRPPAAAAAAGRSPAILVLFPSGLEDGPVAIEAVRSGRSVLLDASRLERGVGQRLVDYTCGGISAMDGRSHRIGPAVFLFTSGLSRVETDRAPHGPPDGARRRPATTPAAR